MEYKHHLPSLNELKTKKRAVRAPHIEHKTSLSFFENLAVKTTKSVGSLGFFVLLFIWTLGWLLWNLYAPLSLRFDPAPAFVIWLILSNIIQLMLLPLIMVGQNFEGRFSELRAQADFEINKTSAREIEVIIAHLENQNELLLELIKKVDKR